MNVLKHNSELNTAEYKAGVVQLKSLPRFVLVELTRGCNLTCPMCRSRRIAPSELMMNDRLFHRLADELFSTADIVDLRGWGESLLVHDIDNKILATSAMAGAVRLVTNLSVYRPEVFRALAQVNAFVVVSLDSADASVLNAIRPGTCLVSVLKHLKELSCLYSDYNGSSDHISIRCTLQRPALSTLWKMAEAAACSGVRQLTLARVGAPAGSPLSVSDSTQIVDAAIEDLLARAYQYGIDVIVSTAMGPSVDVRVCSHPWTHFCVAYDGRVGFCDHLIGPHYDRYAIDSLANVPFNLIWNGAKWQSIRSHHADKSNERFEACLKCATCSNKGHVDYEHVLFPELMQCKLRKREVT